jgi:hypothetical protein
MGERERESFNFLVKKRLCEHEVLNPKKRHKDKRLHVKTKTEKQKNNQTQKERPKTQPQDLSRPSKISHPIPK